MAVAGGIATIPLACRCGAVRGRLADAAPQRVNRVVCYCDDCQAFAQWLGRADLLDPRGGSDIVQVAPGAVTLLQGEDQVAGLRLTAKGLHRFYARCCRTPLGNTVGPAIPFIGIVAQAFGVDGADPGAALGPPIGAIKGEYAIGEPPPGSRGIGLGLMTRAVLKVLGWRLRGLAWPNPFFDRATRRPRFPVEALTPAQRDALRPLCGPRPAATTRT